MKGESGRVVYVAWRDAGGWEMVRMVNVVNYKSQDVSWSRLARKDSMRKTAVALSGAVNRWRDAITATRDNLPSMR